MKQLAFCYHTMSNTFSENSQIGIVSTFSELIDTDFNGDMNALCWHRNLDGDFAAIVEQLSIKENITEVFPNDLLALQLSEKGNTAREIILNDLVNECKLTYNNGCGIKNVPLTIFCISQLVLKIFL